MTEQDRDQRRPRVRITDKRRVSAPDAPGRADPASASPSPTRGVGSGDAPAGPDRTRESPEETPLVTESDSSGEAAGEDPSVVRDDEAPDEETEGKAAEYLEDLRRLKAEFENYRKRVGKEQTRAVDFAAAPVMAKLLEVLDEFELALMAADRSPDFERFVRGVEMVFAKLTDVLRSEGLEPIEAEGKPFDPARHEALLQADGEGEPYVADVLRPGYTLKGRVLRPAGVKVARR
jgi:molecular chaperone GrpE